MVTFKPQLVDQKKLHPGNEPGVWSELQCCISLFCRLFTQAHCVGYALFLLFSMCATSNTFSKSTFLMLRPQNFYCLFMILSKSVLFVDLLTIRQISAILRLFSFERIVQLYKRLDLTQQSSTLFFLSTTIKIGMFLVILFYLQTPLRSYHIDEIRNLSLPLLTHYFYF